jgi:ribonuclease P protein component
VLPKESRLRRRAQFAEAVRQGARAGTPTLVAHLVTDPGTEPRAGFVVSRSVGSAVVRNRVLRQLRHLVRDRLDRLPSGARLVVRATPAAAASSSLRLGADLDRALARLTTAEAKR